MPTARITPDLNMHYRLDDYTDPWRAPDAELLVLPSDSYHVAVTDPERCAQATLDFIARRGGGG